MVFGGRGAPYHFGSKIRPQFDHDRRVFRRLFHTMTDLFPVLAGTRSRIAWGGPIGIARDWWASAGLDRHTGIGWAGGYVGDGVTTTNLAGRTLRDLILGRDSELTRLPWVNHHSRRWEPEPLRWCSSTVACARSTLATPRSDYRSTQPVSQSSRTVRQLTKTHRPRRFAAAGVPTTHMLIL